MPRAYISTLDQAREHLAEWGVSARVETPRTMMEADLAKVAGRLNGWIKPPAEALASSVAASRVEAVLRLLDGWSTEMAASVRAEFGIRGGSKVKIRWVSYTLGREVKRFEYTDWVSHGLVFVAARLRPVLPEAVVGNPTCQDSA